MSIASKLAKALAKETAGQKQIKKATKGQRAYVRGQGKAAAAGAGITAGLAGLSIAQLQQRLKDATTEAERQATQAAIEKALRQIAQEDSEFQKNTKAKGGMPKKYAKGGYSNCGASMKATQKSTNMMYGGMAKKDK